MNLRVSNYILYSPSLNLKCVNKIKLAREDWKHFNLEEEIWVIENGTKPPLIFSSEPKQDLQKDRKKSAAVFGGSLGVPELIGPCQWEKHKTKELRE